MLIEHHADGVRCTLEGHIDTVVSQQLDGELATALAEPKPVTLDLSEVTYICSAFLRVCLHTAKSVGEGQFHIIGVTPPIKRVFMMAGLADILGIE